MSHIDKAIAKFEFLLSLFESEKVKDGEFLIYNLYGEYPTIGDLKILIQEAKLNQEKEEDPEVREGRLIWGGGKFKARGKNKRQ